ncbi:MAG: hypothetical protein JWR48_2302 [Mycobacterium sp.]|nr:hypothetical protein [Mycobacterium sp.]
MPSSRMRSEYIDRSLSAGQNCRRASRAEPTAIPIGGLCASMANLCGSSKCAVDATTGSPLRAASARSVVSRRILAKSDAGKSQVLPSTASVMAPKAAARPKSSGRSLRNARMSSAASSPMFSMWCSEPESMWNISPAPTVKLENLL